MGMSTALAELDRKWRSSETRVRIAPFSIAIIHLLRSPPSRFRQAALKRRTRLINGLIQAISPSIPLLESEFLFLGRCQGPPLSPCSHAFRAINGTVLKLETGAPQLKQSMTSAIGRLVVFRLPGYFQYLGQQASVACRSMGARSSHPSDRPFSPLAPRLHRPPHHPDENRPA